MYTGGHERSTELQRAVFSHYSDHQASIAPEWFSYLEVLLCELASFAKVFLICNCELSDVSIIKDLSLNSQRPLPNGINIQLSKDSGGPRMREKERRRGFIKKISNLSDHFVVFWDTSWLLCSFFSTRVFLSDNSFDIKLSLFVCFVLLTQETLALPEISTGDSLSSKLISLITHLEVYIRWRLSWITYLLCNWVMLVNPKENKIQGLSLKLVNFPPYGGIDKEKEYFLNVKRGGTWMNLVNMNAFCQCILYMLCLKNQWSRNEYVLIYKCHSE